MERKRARKMKLFRSKEKKGETTGREDGVKRWMIWFATLVWCRRWTDKTALEGSC